MIIYNINIYVYYVSYMKQLECVLHADIKAVTYPYCIHDIRKVKLHRNIHG